VNKICSICGKKTQLIMENKDIRKDCIREISELNKEKTPLK